MENSNEAQIWIDVRTRGEYIAGHLKIDAPSQIFNIPCDEIEYRIGEITKDTNAQIHLYCLSGARVDYAVSLLKALGYTNLINKGSIRTLMMQGYQLVAE